MNELVVNDLIQLTFPTGKAHVSFSEVGDWVKCPYRHYKKHVQKIDLGTPAPVLEFGTAVHASCENFIKTRVMDMSPAIEHIRAKWKEYDGKFGFIKIDEWEAKAHAILAEVSSFINDEFPGWETVEAEELLYESIPSHDLKFKGYIDAVIKVKNKKGKIQYWLLDWKTTSWGWSRLKLQDFMTSAQLIMYKTFWAAKHQVPMPDIRTGFVLLKKDGKTGSRCQLIPVSVGPKTSVRAKKIIENMINSVQKGIKLKNRNSCTYCEYSGTEHCT